MICYQSINKNDVATSDALESNQNNVILYIILGRRLRTKCKKKRKSREAQICEAPPSNDRE